MSGHLEGRTAVVSGASRGIGLAIAEGLAAAGCKVAMVARSAEVLRDHGKRIPGAVPVPCDLTDARAIDAAIVRIGEELAPVPDIVVNNAGGFPLARIEETSVELFAETMQLNLIAPFALVQGFLGAMRARGSGHVVTIGSIADRMTFPENGAYAASKFGIRALHQVLRDELRGSGVRATLVSPGPVDTPIWDAIAPDERAGFTPRARMLAAAAVANAVLFALTRPAETNIDELRLSRS